jgi:hypothetical protein
MTARITPDELEARMALNTRCALEVAEAIRRIDPERAITHAHVADAAYAVLEDVFNDTRLLAYPVIIDTKAVRAKLPSTVSGHDALVPPPETLERMVVAAFSAEYVVTLNVVLDDYALVCLEKRRATPSTA